MLVFFPFAFTTEIPYIIEAEVTYNYNSFKRFLVEIFIIQKCFPLVGRILNEKQLSLRQSADSAGENIKMLYKLYC